MSKKMILILIVLLLLNGCGTESVNENAVPELEEIVVTDTAVPINTPIPTPVPINTPIPTSVPLAEIDLAILLPEYGEADSEQAKGYMPGILYDELPEMYSEISGYENAINLPFIKDGKTNGGIALMVFEDESQLTTAYELLEDTMVVNEDELEQLEGFHNVRNLTRIGEQGITSDMSLGISGMHLEITEALFSRCGALVHIRATKSGMQAITYYAQLVDNSIVQILCDHTAE